MTKDRVKYEITAKKVYAEIIEQKLEQLPIIKFKEVK